ncbi:MAG: tRNA uracil 4-sulfurtransferase ThiI [Planctomycetota bacterium]
MDHVVVRPGELALKGRNRKGFEDCLLRNLRAVLRPLGVERVERRWGRFYVGPVNDARRIAAAAARVFGVVHTSPALRCANEPAALSAAAAETVRRWLAARPGTGDVPFKVRVKRADKAYPEPSMDCARRLGGELQAAFPRLVARLDAPELLLECEVREEGSFVFVERLEGPGGLPVGSEGKVLCLLSGGIDSPVAAWLMMKRGCRVELVHFDAQPFTGPGSLEKVRALARVLDGWQGDTRLWVVPFAPVQVATKDLPQPGYRTVLYRRFMTRIAERLAGRRRCQALVTGDSLGQVASQTLENLAAVEGARGRLPLLRPLLTFDKVETIRLAERVGTYEVSIRPFEDCCTLFQPDHPVTRGKAEVAARLEAMVDVDALVEAGLAAAREEDVARVALG